MGGLKWWARWWVRYFPRFAYRRLFHCRGNHAAMYDGYLYCLHCAAPWFGRDES